VLDWLWELPALTNASRLLKLLTNGWEVSDIFTVSDGLPFTPLISGDAAGENSSSAYDVPNQVVGPACTHLTNPGNPSQYINLACYSFPVPANLLGNAGRNSLIGPGLVELDFSLHRSIRVRLFSDAARFEVRAEVFNLTNRSNFEPPLPNNPLYNNKGAPLAIAGLITSTATTSRQIQVALRLSW